MTPAANNRPAVDRGQRGSALATRGLGAGARDVGRVAGRPVAVKAAGMRREKNRGAGGPQRQGRERRFVLSFFFTLPFCFLCLFGAHARTHTRTTSPRAACASAGGARVRGGGSLLIYARRARVYARPRRGVRRARRAGRVHRAGGRRPVRQDDAVQAAGGKFKGQRGAFFVWVRAIAPRDEKCKGRPPRGAPPTPRVAAPVTAARYASVERGWRRRRRGGQRGGRRGNRGRVLGATRARTAARARKRLGPTLRFQPHHHNNNSSNSWTPKCCASPTAPRPSAPSSTPT